LAERITSHLVYAGSGVAPWGSRLGAGRQGAVARAALLLLVLGLGAGVAWAGEVEAPVLKRVEVVGGPAAAETGKTAGAEIYILEVTERPLKQVLDYLSTLSSKNIRCKKSKDERLPVTFKLEKVTYRTVLDFIAKKYGMVVDDSMEKQDIILLDTPEKVSMVFSNADIRDVINTIAIQANANVVIDQDILGTVSMRLENVPWKSALEMVVKTRDYVAIQEPDNTIRITTPAKVEKQLEIRMFRLAYISPEGSKYTPMMTSSFIAREGAAGAQQGPGAASLIEVLKNVKSQQGTISFEKRSNTIIVRDTSMALENMETIIKKLDVPPKQIHVAVKLVSLNDTDLESLGMDWGSNGIQFTLNPMSGWASAFPFDVSGGLSQSLLGTLAVAEGTRRVIDPVTGQLSLQGAQDVFPVREQTINRWGTTQGSTLTSVNTASLNNSMTFGSMGFQGTQAILRMIMEKTRTRVIQAPQIITLDNEEAAIQVGELIRYAEEALAASQTGNVLGGFREAAGSPITTGFTLMVIAHVTGPENNVLLTIIPKTETFERFNSTGTLQLPQTSHTIMLTKMMLRNGETGVIGGLKQENEKYTDRKVPILGEIPFIGRLFKFHDKNNSGSSLLVFVTPTIVDFYEADQFKKELEKIRQDYSKPFTTIGEEEDVNPK